MLIAKFLHVLGFTLWIGGMFFSVHILRPAAAGMPPDSRVKLWAGVLRRFFLAVWVAVVLVFASGIYMIAQLGTMPGYVTAMFMLGVLMLLVFAMVYFAPYKTLLAAVEAEHWQAGGAALGQIRKLVGLNLVLGVLTIAVGILGKLV